MLEQARARAHAGCLAHLLHLVVRNMRQARDEEEQQVALLACSRPQVRVCATLVPLRLDVQRRVVRRPIAANKVDGVDGHAQILERLKIRVAHVHSDLGLTLLVLGQLLARNHLALPMQSSTQARERNDRPRHVRDRLLVPLQRVALLDKGVLERLGALDEMALLVLVPDRRVCLDLRSLILWDGLEIAPRAPDISLTHATKRNGLAEFSVVGRERLCAPLCLIDATNLACRHA